MFDQANKLNVFISSACGEGREKYNLVRAGLKVILESTSFVRKVYLFEEEGASTLPTGQHYSSSLEESDVCIFLIDNSDGIPDGVLKEVQIANKYNIKSLYYFCDQNSKEKTQLQTNLQGTQYEKYCTIHSFEDILKKGAEDLLADLLRVYKVYCKGLMKFEHDDGTNNNLQIARSYSKESLVAEKETVANIDKCKLYFYNLLLPKIDPHEIKSTSLLDDICYDFLPCLFECSQIKDATVQALLAEIRERQEPSHFLVTCKRFEAIKCYFRGNTEGCLLMLQDALDSAKASHLPAWLINDILIDLRNQQSIIDDEKNIITFDSVFQQELNTNREVLFYPLLDRFGREGYELIIEDEIEQRLKSPQTITYGTKLKQYTDFLAAKYTVALYNGSITHLRRLYDDIKFIAFFYADRHATWNFKLALIKMLVVNYSIKELSQVKVHFSDILGKLNARDAIEIYNFANNNHVAYQCFSSKLTAFSLVGCYLDDAQFQCVWNDLCSRILSWCQSPTAVISLGNHIFKSVYENRYRINQTQIIEIVLACFRNKLRRFYDDAISLTYHLEIECLPDSYVTELITLLHHLTVDDDPAPKRCTKLKVSQSGIMSAKEWDQCQGKHSRWSRSSSSYGRSRCCAGRARQSPRR